MLARRTLCATMPWLLAGLPGRVRGESLFGARPPHQPRAQHTRNVSDSGYATVSLLLVLAVDVSGSVDTARFELQKRGYAAAFRDVTVKAAIRATPTGSIAVAMTQWTGPELQAVAVDWTLIDGDAAADAFADAIDRTPRALFGGGTSISGAIDHARTMFPLSRFQSARRVIDVSGDGANNRGRPVAEARDAAVQAGMVINGLPILALEPDLDVHYRTQVIGGPGAFVLPAKTYDTFAEAIRGKLVVEIAQRPQAGHTALAGRAP
jgi:hypothetical protein